MFVYVILCGDNVQLYLKRPIRLSEDLVICFIEDLESINKWAVINEFHLNPQKTQLIETAKHNFDITVQPPLLFL